MLKIGIRLFFLFFFSFLYLPSNACEPHSLTINILSRELFNGAGKEVDVMILKNELEGLGHRVCLFEYLEETNITPADINIFLAKFTIPLFSTAKLNWLLVNPDFCYGTLEEISQFDLVLCKTEESLRIFKPISKKTHYLGFTSLDCYVPYRTK